jgi:hypothetical protein
VLACVLLLRELGAAKVAEALKSKATSSEERNCMIAQGDCTGLGPRIAVMAQNRYSPKAIISVRSQAFANICKCAVIWLLNSHGVLPRFSECPRAIVSTNKENKTPGRSSGQSALRAKIILLLALTWKRLIFHGNSYLSRLLLAWKKTV